MSQMTDFSRFLFTGVQQYIFRTCRVRDHTPRVRANYRSFQNEKRHLLWPRPVRRRLENARISFLFSIQYLR